MKSRRRGTSRARSFLWVRQPPRFRTPSLIRHGPKARRRLVCEHRSRRSSPRLCRRGRLVASSSANATTHLDMCERREWWRVVKSTRVEADEGCRRWTDRVCSDRWSRPALTSRKEVCRLQSVSKPSRRLDVGRVWRKGFETRGEISRDYRRSHFSMDTGVVR